jgi:hypothetical protein
MRSSQKYGSPFQHPAPRREDLPPQKAAPIVAYGMRREGVLWIMDEVQWWSHRALRDTHRYREVSEAPPHRLLKRLQNDLLVRVQAATVARELRNHRERELRHMERNYGDAW